MHLDQILARDAAVFLFFDIYVLHFQTCEMSLMYLRCSICASQHK